MGKGDLMDSNFEFGALDHLFARIMEDETGELRKTIDDIVMKCHTAAKLGVRMDELASIVTMAHHMAHNPEVQQILAFMMEQTKPEPDTFH
mgnify:CR=1 FL=1